MSDFAVASAENGLSPVEQMRDLLSTADASTFDICASLYSIILSTDTIQRSTLFEAAINLYEDIDSDESVKLQISPFSEQKKALKEQYGDIVNSFIEFFTNQKGSSDAFYNSLWDAIQNDIFFPTEASKVFAFYYIVIDRRVPYFELGQGYGMSNESYRKLRKKHASLLKKIRYILNAEVAQKTERASLLLQELGIALPGNEDGIEVINEYEQKLMVMVEVLNETKKPDLAISAMFEHIRDSLPE